MNSKTNSKEDYVKIKQERREKKRIVKRSTDPEEVIFIFEKVLEGWPTIRIYNTIIQNNPDSAIDKKKVEQIATGNSKVYESEMTKERYAYYQELREKVYSLH
jgi:hypothetical protein